MTDLTPAAQAVLDALCMDELNGPQQLMARAHAAAALHAAADQLAVTNGECPGVTVWESGFLAGANGAREALLALAAELEGAQ